MPEEARDSVGSIYYFILCHKEARDSIGSIYYFILCHKKPEIVSVVHTVWSTYIYFFILCQKKPEVVYGVYTSSYYSTR